MSAFLLIVALTLVHGAAACRRGDPDRYAAQLEQATKTAPKWIGRDPLAKRLWAIEQQFYADRGHRPAWIDGEAPSSRLDDLLAALRDAELHGLDPAAYGYEALTAARASADERWFGATFEAADVPDLDVRLTYAFLSHAADLLGWRSSPREVDPQWLPSKKKVDVGDRLRAALDGEGVRKVLDELAPAHPQYKGLQAALARARKGGAEAARVDIIRMNLERWRWAPRDLGERHILVNVPSYQMQVIEDDKPVLAMRVIVGAPDTPTPLFSDEITYLVFSPYWNIPENILREETLPRIAEDPEYLSRNNIEVVGTSGEVIDPSSVDWREVTDTEHLRFRQAPGPENALGLVKFIFPNHFSVYLHDTPTDALFNKPARALSHGCIRVEKPVALAEYVLRDKQQWTPERIRAAMDGREEQTVRLKAPLPVHIGYWTAWVEADGSVSFVDDPYGLDRRQAALEAKRGQPVKPRDMARAGK